MCFGCCLGLKQSLALADLDYFVAVEVAAVAAGLEKLQQVAVVAAAVLAEVTVCLAALNFPLPV